MLFCFFVPVIYRGCADGWTSSLIERDYNGCKVQYTWGRPVEWCFCDSHLCNGESLKHIKAMYNSHITGKFNIRLWSVLDQTVRLAFGGSRVQGASY